MLHETLIEDMQYICGYISYAQPRYEKQWVQYIFAHSSPFIDTPIARVPDCSAPSSTNRNVIIGPRRNIPHGTKEIVIVLYCVALAPWTRKSGSGVFQSQGISQPIQIASDDEHDANETTCKHLPLLQKRIGALVKAATLRVKLGKLPALQNQ